MITYGSKWKEFEAVKSALGKDYESQLAVLQSNFSDPDTNAAQIEDGLTQILNQELTRLFGTNANAAGILLSKKENKEQLSDQDKADLQGILQAILPVTDLRNAAIGAILDGKAKSLAEKINEALNGSEDMESVYTQSLADANESVKKIPSISRIVSAEFVSYDIANLAFEQSCEQLYHPKSFRFYFKKSLEQIKGRNQEETKSRQDHFVNSNCDTGAITIAMKLINQVKSAADGSGSVLNEVSFLLKLKAESTDAFYANFMKLTKMNLDEQFVQMISGMVTEKKKVKDESTEYEIKEPEKLKKRFEQYVYLNEAAGISKETVALSTAQIIFGSIARTSGFDKYIDNADSDADKNIDGFVDKAQECLPQEIFDKGKHFMRQTAATSYYTQQARAHLLKIAKGSTTVIEAEEFVKLYKEALTILGAKSSRMFISPERPSNEEIEEFVTGLGIVQRLLNQESSKVEKIVKINSQDQSKYAEWSKLNEYSALVLQIAADISAATQGMLDNAYENIRAASYYLDPNHEFHPNRPEGDLAKICSENLNKVKRLREHLAEPLETILGDDDEIFSEIDEEATNNYGEALITGNYERFYELVSAESDARLDELKTVYGTYRDGEDKKIEIMIKGSAEGINSRVHSSSKYEAAVALVERVIDERKKRKEARAEATSTSGRAHRVLNFLKKHW